MVDGQLQHTFVILTDWRGHVVWNSKFDAKVQAGELAWARLKPESKTRAAEAHARAASLRQTQCISVVNVEDQHFRCWLWPLETPEIAVCALGLEVPKELSELTERELECLNLLALGLPVAEIAERLDISVSTVHTHLKRAREALRLDNLEALISLAARYCYPPSQSLLQRTGA
jgi:DNA-binding CsgD family transcriptional regulator